MNACKVDVQYACHNVAKSVDDSMQPFDREYRSGVLAQEVYFSLYLYLNMV
jgi:hypothetical protein